MSDPFALVKARLESAPILAGRVRDTALTPTGEVFHGNYLLLFMAANPDELVTERLGRSSQPGDDADWVFTVRAVAVDAAGVRLLAQAAFSQLVGWVPTLSGRKFSAVSHEGAVLVREDPTLKPSLFFAEDDYSVRSWRA